MDPGFLTTIAPPFDTVEDTDNPQYGGAPSIYDNPPAGATQSQEPVNGDVDPFPDSYRRGPTPPELPSPSPMIFTVPTGGIVLDAGTVSLAAGAPVVKTIGGTTEGRPDVMGILLLPTAGAGTVEVMPNGSPDSLGAGFLLPVAAPALAPIFLPIRRANVRLTGVVTLSFMVIAAGISQGR